MRAVVLGAGVIGVSTAYFLARAGHEVHVIDRQPGAGLETSFANGGQISTSHAEPWANPMAPVHFARWLGRSGAPVIFRPRLDTRQWAWALRFWLNCLPGRTRANTEKILRLALYSRAQLAGIMAGTDLEFDLRSEGIMHIYRDQRSLDRAARQAEFLAGMGCACELLDGAGCVEREPALAPSQDQLAGAVYSRDDASGDAHKFTQGLAAHCASLGVEFSFDTEINDLTAKSGRITSAETTQGEIAGDTFILSLGSYTPLMLKRLGLKTAIYPAKGYSVTLPTEGHGGAPKVSLTDDYHKLV
ncbi:MAG: FAD-dependent oxidoreductase, partial [Rhodospirillales bacterium]|nr:FAD-dependent oxidoreductase [Rhodospirillales bacterium]